MSMNIQIATAPCSWGVFYPDGGASGIPCDLFLQQAFEAGYVQIELGPDGYLPQNTNELKKLLEEHHLAVCAGTATIPFGLLTAEACEPYVHGLAERLAALGTKDMVVMDGSCYEHGLEDKAAWTQETWDRIYQDIFHVHTYLRDKFGIRMVFHPHANTAIEYTEEIEKMLALADDIALCFDTGHHAFSNGGTEKGDQSALEFLRAHADRIPYLHFKNVDGAVRRRAVEENWTTQQAFQAQVMCDLEEGIIDFRELKNVLEEIGYQGTAVIEQDMFSNDWNVAFETAKRNLQYLQRIGMIS